MALDEAGVPEPTSTQPANAQFEAERRRQRFWAIPIIGGVAKVVILIPHLVIIAAILVAVFALWLVMWIPVLVSGEYPAGPYYLATGLSRWVLRVSAFQGGLTDRYPPFSLD